MVRKSNKFNVEYTNKDIMDKLDTLHNITQDIKIQTTRTNGRVLSLETNNKIIIGAIVTIFVAIIVTILTKLI